MPWAASCAVTPILRAFTFAMIAVFTASFAHAVTAPEVSKTERAEVRLIADAYVAAPGETISLALHQQMQGAWHTYWRNPGDSGYQTTIEWTAPPGVEIGEIIWPAPHRIDVPPLANYGYKHEAVLISQLRVPDDWPAGQPIEVQAKADWLICEELCIPESQSYTLSIPTGAGAIPDSSAAKIIAKGRESWPASGEDLPVIFAQEGDALVFELRAAEMAEGLEDVYFFPAEYGVINHFAQQVQRKTPGGLQLVVPKGDLWEDGPVAGPIEGVLRAKDLSSGAPIELVLKVSAQTGVLGAPAQLGAGAVEGMSVLGAALFAFLGGVILNLMPCVFPILALKALSFTKHAEAAAQERKVEGLAYGAGVLISFLGVAGVLLALKAAGAAVGWGFQLQSPIVVAVLAYVLFAVGLNLSGVFELSASITGPLARLGGGSQKAGPVGSCFTGVLAVAVASPCTAPFMGAALGYALTQSAGVTLIVFTGLALGFAAPIIALSLAPGVAALLPKPGVWMERFRQALAFPMYLAAAWLAWVLGKLAGVDALFAALAGAVLIALAGWALGAGAPASNWGRCAAKICAAAALVGAVWLLSPSYHSNGSAQAASQPQQASDGAIAFSPAALADLRAQGKTVFINFTADWCISCKVNERLVLSSTGFKEALADSGAVYMKGDWTRRGPEILAVLQSFGRVGVPLYVVYPADGSEPVVLPQILTNRIVSDALALR